MMRRVLQLVLLFLLATPAWGVVAFDAVASGQGTTATTSWTHTPVGTPTGVIVDVISGAATHSGVTYGGVAMTKVGVTVVNGRSVSQWKLGSPPTGAQTVTVTLSVAVSNVGGSITVTGSDGTTAGMTGSQFTNTGTSTSVSVAVTSAAGELVIDSAGISNTTLTVAGTGETQRFNLAQGTTTGAGGTTAGAASVTMAWTGGASKTWAISGLSVKAAGGAAPCVNFIALLGAGCK